MLPPLRPGRKIDGASAVLLPFDAPGSIDWSAFDRHVERTAAAGITPAVNMDTGYGHLLSDEQRQQVLDRTRAVAGGNFFAGTVVTDSPGAAFDAGAYAAEIEKIEARGGTPVVFQSYGLAHQAEDAVLENYRQIAAHCDRFVGFELGQQFAPFGRIYSLGLFERLLAVPQCVGLKHSSLSRQAEWDRLAARDRVRPEFRLYTGNDLAIDMVMYGSDYLLGLSTMAPDAFALRDRMWQDGDARFYELNDVLQYLGMFAFRSPTPAYKHNAAMMLHLRGQIATDLTHPDAPTRPAGDREVLAGILEDLEAKLA